MSIKKMPVKLLLLQRFLRKTGVFEPTKKKLLYNKMQVSNQQANNKKITNKEKLIS